MFYIPDFMEIQTPRAFPNRPERWWDNLESAEDFSHGEGRLFPNAPAYFHRGAALFFSPIPQGMGNTIVPTEEKGGSSVLNSGLHEKTKPQELSQTARGDGGTIRKVRKIFPLTRAGSPVMHQCIFAEGWPCSPPNPAGNGKHKSSHRRKKVGAVFCIPDFMEIQTPRAFPNCPGQWRDNSESAGDFSPGEG